MIVYQIVDEYKKLDGVTAITLAGSGASGRNDELSDIDIDIITSKDISIDKREAIAKIFSDDTEINNNFWGEGDEYILRNSNIHVDIAYFNMSWLVDNLYNVMEQFNASTGYTTCFWHNVKNSSILFDKEGKFLKLKNKYNIPFPNKLKENIISKNYPILKNNFSSYYNQIEKAIKRDDIVSINHRVAAFLASYFDIIFAVNEMAHPGEKRLVSIVEKKCPKKPYDFLENISKLLKRCSDGNISILDSLNKIVYNLDRLLKNEELI